MRTPFDPMSDAATSGGDATSTSREGLQQVRLAKSLPKNWAVRMLAYSGRPVFLATADRRRTRATNLRRTEACLGVWRRGPLTICASKRGRILGSYLICSAETRSPVTASPTRAAAGRRPVFRVWGGHVVAAIGRHSSPPKCGGRRAAVQRISALGGATAGGPSFGLGAGIR